MLDNLYLSYSRDDREFTFRVASLLVVHGVQSWFGFMQDLSPQDWIEDPEIALRDSPYMAVVLSPASVRAPEVADDIDLARELGKAIFPLMAESCEIPPALERLQFIDFRDDLEWGVMILVDALQEAGYQPFDPMTAVRNPLSYRIPAPLFLGKAMYVPEHACDVTHYNLPISLRQVLSPEVVEAALEAKGELESAPGDAPEGHALVEGIARLLRRGGHLLSLDQVQSIVEAEKVYLRLIEIE
jgi:hypothetical protein